ncbi:MAG: hypothetical protein NZ765_02550 [Anaerolineae bacterium]|nr:hypothetical protein [Anaerolineae bacterium]MDW8070424.1 hypothetical protein [Anaerolineae bacterium]
MTKIICRASDCIHWDDGICSSEQITYDPEGGCLTYEGIEDAMLEDDEEWEEEEEILDEEPLEWEEEEEEDLFDEDEEDEDDWR